MSALMGTGLYFSPAPRGALCRGTPPVFISEKDGQVGRELVRLGRIPGEWGKAQSLTQGGEGAGLRA